MRHLLRTLIVATAALVAVVAFYLGFTVPSPTVQLALTSRPFEATGAYHIHTERSDGSGTVDAIALAAARAGLAFVVFTDHGDATRAPDPPMYRHGVLCIDAIELNATEGHLVALGLTAAAPYPLAGPARDVIEDVHRMGGVVVLAHPDSPRSSLRWRGNAVPADGIEWLNVDSEWRDEPPTRLAASVVRSLFRPAETIVSLFSRPDRTLQRWDSASRGQATFGLAALDAHARLGWRDADAEESRSGASLAQPSYEALFKTVAQTVLLEAPLSGDPARDQARVLQALITGRSFSIVRGIAGPASLTFEGRVGSTSIAVGSRIESGPDPVQLRADIVGAPGATTRILRNGREVAAGRGSATHLADESGVYRAEAAFPNADVPWLVSNAIVITARPAPQSELGLAGRGRFAARNAPGIGSVADGRPGTPFPGEGRGSGRFSGGPEAGLGPQAPRVSAVDLLPWRTMPWTIERDASSTGGVDVSPDGLAFHYGLGPGKPSGQYVALVAPITSPAAMDRVIFTARATRPLRVSVQVRVPGGRDGQRWRRSVFLDETPREIVVRLQDFDPAGTPTTRRPVAVPIHSLLFVMDTVNAHTATTGTIWFSALSVGIDRSLTPVGPASRP